MGPRGGGDFAAGFAFEEEGGLGPGGGGWDFAGAARRERPGDARRGPKGAAAVGALLCCSAKRLLPCPLTLLRR